MPKLLPKPNLVLPSTFTASTTTSSNHHSTAEHSLHTQSRRLSSPVPLVIAGDEGTYGVGNSASSSLSALSRRRTHHHLGSGDGAPRAKRRTLEEAFEVSEENGELEDDEDHGEVEVILDNGDEILQDDHEGNINGLGDASGTAVVDGKTIYLMQYQDVKESLRYDGGERKDFIVKMPSTTESVAMASPAALTTEVPTRRTLRPIKPALPFQHVVAGVSAAVEIPPKTPPNSRHKGTMSGFLDYGHYLILRPL